MSGGALIRFKVETAIEYRGAGLGTRKSLKLDKIVVMDTWAANPKSACTNSPVSPAARGPSPSRSPASPPPQQLFFEGGTRGSSKGDKG